MVSRGFKAILLGVLLWSAVSFPQVLVDKVVASVNSEPILESDIKLGSLYYGTTNRRLILQKLIDTTLIYQYLQGRGLSVPQEVVENAIENIAKANNTRVDAIALELKRENLTLEDLKRFIAKDILATQGLYAFLSRDLKVSDIDVEVEKLKRGEVKVIRDIELLVVDKKDQKKLGEVFKPEKSLQDIAGEMGLNLERLGVSRGDLVEVLDKEVWSAPVGDMVFAEDKEHVYIAKVLSQREVYEGKSKEELMQELMEEKLAQKEKELLERLRKNSFIQILE
ncbi:MAG: peptidylprolyl isomerase [Aquificota bacterium]|nr:MAG: peptidylprolyl isomerase [Aquificota bacterium]